MHEEELNIQLETTGENELNIEKKYNIPKKLRVYIDYERQKYYIDMSAAYALKLITYNQWIAKENGYYEITSRQFNEFEQIYEIVYEYFDIQQEKDRDIISDLDVLGNNTNRDFKKDINDLKVLRQEIMQRNIHIDDNYKNTQKL